MKINWPMLLAIIPITILAVVALGFLALIINVSAGMLQWLYQ